jgi:hypothetical protein
MADKKEPEQEIGKSNPSARNVLVGCPYPAIFDLKLKSLLDNGVEAY